VEDVLRNSLAYVCGCELLVGAEDGAAALGGIECTLALDGGLAVGTRSTDGLADLGDLVPVAHCDCVVWLVCWRCVSRVVVVRWLLRGSAAVVGWVLYVVARVEEGQGWVEYDVFWPVGRRRRRE
jgi:hypothetical protein